MKEWIKTNAKPLAFGSGIVVLYALSYFPQFKPESDLIATLLAVFGLGGTVAIPNFQRPPKDEPQPPENV